MFVLYKYRLIIFDLALLGGVLIFPFTAPARAAITGLLLPFFIIDCLLVRFPNNTLGDIRNYLSLQGINIQRFIEWVFWSGIALMGITVLLFMIAMTSDIGLLHAFAMPFLGVFGFTFVNFAAFMRKTVKNPNY